MKMGNTRDDFSEAVKTILHNRVGGFCSNPNCRVQTIGPHSDPSKRLSIGIAAHITAAAPGGPRYNPDIESAYRSSAENGIWLCASCASLIDKDADAYPVETLISWKMQAEAEQNYRLLNPRRPNSNLPPVNINNNVVINNNGSGSVNVDLSLWRELGQNLEKYQSSIDYAYENWTHNFKNKYPRISEAGTDRGSKMFNPDYQALQDEIDTHGDTLYGDMLVAIYEGFKETQAALMESVNALRIDMSEKLENLFRQYIECMSFHYDSDGGAGLVNYYWSSFFMALDQNYEQMCKLKLEIDGCLRLEYAMAKGDYL